MPLLLRNMFSEHHSASCYYQHFSVTLNPRCIFFKFSARMFVFDILHEYEAENLKNELYSIL